MSDFKEEAFTNEFGQVINPGDEVIYAGTGWKQTTIRKGVFAGVYYDNVYVTEYFYDENGGHIFEEVESYGRKIRRAKFERKQKYIPVAVKVSGVDDGYKYEWVTEDGKRRYVKTDEKKYRTAILPRKRVYRLDTPMESMVGKTF